MTFIKKYPNLIATSRFAAVIKVGKSRVKVVFEKKFTYIEVTGKIIFM